MKRNIIHIEMEEYFSVEIWTDQDLNSRSITSLQYELGKIIFSLYSSFFIFEYNPINFTFISLPSSFLCKHIDWKSVSFQALCRPLKDRMLNNSDGVLARRFQASGIVVKKNWDSVCQSVHLKILSHYWGPSFLPVAQSCNLFRGSGE